MQNDLCTVTGETITTPADDKRWQAEQLAAAIEGSILAFISHEVHHNHRYDTMPKAHEELVSALLSLF